MKIRNWTYRKGDDRNPLNGRVIDEEGGLLFLRAVADDDDEAIMKLTAAAPDLAFALRAMLETYAPRANLTVAQYGEHALHSAVRASRAALEKAGIKIG